jgi:DNA-binding transcriptional ArsR family regulator
VLRIRARTPLADRPTRLTRPALADRLLEHLGALSTEGVVERPLVEVAKALDVGAPSVSRALGRLVEEGLARVDQVGTRSRPTRIALVPSPDDDALEQLREENERLVAEVARLRALLDQPVARRRT